MCRRSALPFPGRRGTHDEASRVDREIGGTRVVELEHEVLHAAIHQLDEMVSAHPGIHAQDERGMMAASIRKFRASRSPESTGSSKRGVPTWHGFVIFQLRKPFPLPMRSKRRLAAYRSFPPKATYTPVAARRPHGWRRGGSDGVATGPTRRLQGRSQRDGSGWRRHKLKRRAAV